MIQLTQAEYEDFKRKATAFDKLEDLWCETKTSEAERIAMDLLNINPDKLEDLLVDGATFIDIVESVER